MARAWRTRAAVPAACASLPLLLFVASRTEACCNSTAPEGARANAMAPSAGRRVRAARVATVLIAVVLLLSGAAILTVGAEAAIRGVVRFGRERGITTFALGALLFGIDIESLGAVLVASGRGRTALAAG